MPVEGEKRPHFRMTSSRRNLTAMFLWPVFDTIKILRYMQGGEGVASLFLEEEAYNEVAINLHLDLFTQCFNLLQRLAEIQNTILTSKKKGTDQIDSNSLLFSLCQLETILYITSKDRGTFTLL